MAQSYLFPMEMEKTASAPVEIDLDGKRVLLVGTAHVSRESAETVERTISENSSDAVCVELDAARLEALRQPDRWRSLDLRAVIRRRQLPTLIANLILASYQRRLGMGTKTLPGTELLAAVESAERNGVRVELVDREIRVTLKRVWRLTGLWKKAKLLAALCGALFEKEQMDEDKLRELQDQETLGAMLDEMGEELPQLKQVLIDERDLVLAERIRECEGKVVVAVVGAGHVPGIRRILREKARPIDDALAVPPPSPWGKAVGWAIPLGIVLAVALTARIDPQAAQEGAAVWILATGSLCALGGLVSLAHPLAILSGFLAAPITTLSPLLGAGYVTGLVQLFVAPPAVSDLEALPDEIGQPRRWWRNRALKVFLVFLLTSLGAAAGNLIGTVEIVRRFVGAL